MIVNTRIIKHFLILLLAEGLLAQWQYPESKVETIIDELHGVRISDDYRWLENGSDPATVEWVRQQTVFSRSILDSLPARDQIRDIISQLYSMPSMSTPFKYGQRYFYTRQKQGQNHPVVYFTDNYPGVDEQIILDPNTFSADGTVGLDWDYPSPTGKFLAYGYSPGGSEISNLKIRSVDSNKDLSLTIPYTRASSVAWLPDESGFYYIRYPEPGTVPEGDEYYYRRLFYHAITDTTWRDDPMIFGADLGKEDWVDAYPSSDNKYLFISVSVNWAINDLFLMPINEPSELVPLAVGLDGRFVADIFDQEIYLLTNLAAPRFKIMRTRIDQPDLSNWQEIIPESAARLDKFVFTDGQLAVVTMEDVVSHLWMYSLDGKRKWEIPMPTMGSIDRISGKPRSYDLFFDFKSFAYQPTIFHFDLFTDQLSIHNQPELVVDLTPYIVKQVFYSSSDGTSIPMFIIHDKDLTLTNDAPTLLYGYGGFDVSMNPYFSKTVIPWLKVGGVYAVANIRGGGEYGREWHEAARLEQKQNSYSDFIAAGEWLIDNKYTSSGKLAIMGGSNGGLLVGAAITQRPDLWQAAVCAVPLLDMIRYHKFSIARLWIPEFGSADDPEQFKFIYTYSPYHNVKSYTDYPATMFTTSEYDSRVDPMHACKMTALLQKKNIGNRPIILRYESSAGHGKGKPASKDIDSRTDQISFLLWQLGVE